MGKALTGQETSWLDWDGFSTYCLDKINRLICLTGNGCAIGEISSEQGAMANIAEKAANKLHLFKPEEINLGQK